MEIVKLEYTDVFDDNQIKELVFSKHLIESDFNERSLFALMVDGSSMEPLINHKAVIVTDLSQKELQDKAIYILYHSEKMWVKSYNKKSDAFISINPQFSHLVYEKEDIHLIARVVLTFTNL